LNTGHGGSLATIHANSAEKALRRFANLVMRSHAQATISDVEAEIAEAVNLVVHVERQPGRRRISEVLEIEAYDRRLQRFETTPLYRADCSPESAHNLTPESSRKDAHNATA
jgi:pilus assembly protein CpaF